MTATKQKQNSTRFTLSRASIFVIVFSAALSYILTNDRTFSLKFQVARINHHLKQLDSRQFIVFSDHIGGYLQNFHVVCGSFLERAGHQLKKAIGSATQFSAFVDLTGSHFLENFRQFKNNAKKLKKNYFLPLRSYLGKVQEFWEPLKISVLSDNISVLSKRLANSLSTGLRQLNRFLEYILRLYSREMARKNLRMPCVWEEEEIFDGATVTINTFNWTYIGTSNNNWNAPISHSPEITSPDNAFTVSRVNSSGGFSVIYSSWDLWGSMISSSSKPGAIYLAFKAPNGKYLTAMSDSSLLATSGPSETGVPPDCVFLAQKRKHGYTLLSVPSQRFLSAAENGTLRLSGYTAGDQELFTVRRIQWVPKFFGVNLGGWLVTEAWMTPKPLFEGTLKDLQSGTKLSLQSLYTSKWISAEGGGGDELSVNRGSPAGWENFYVTRGDQGGLLLRAGSGHFWTVDSRSRELTASSQLGGFRETFFLRRRFGKESEVQFKASNGKWVQVVGDRLVADIEADPPAWSSSCSFLLQVEATLGGEPQLEEALGLPEASRRLREHRASWITESDFEWMKNRGKLNAARIPIGYWIVEDPVPERPFSGGTLELLDKAFDWSERHSIRIVLCLHALPGSQNGWEHSASLYGVPTWAAKGTNHFDKTVEVIRFLVDRYGGRPSFAGLEPVNEPTVAGAPLDILKEYYLLCYGILRARVPKAFFIVSGRIFGSDRDWDNFMTGAEFTNVIFDAHWYQVHDTGTFGGKSVDFNLNFPVNERKEELRLLERGSRLTYIGEWSLALNCRTSDKIYHDFAFAQIQTYSQSSAGFFFWSLKHGQGWDPWSFKASVERKWILPEWWKDSEELVSKKLEL